MEQQSERSILIVEDEPSISGFIRRGLIFEGYSVEAIDDGRAGLERLRDQRPDLLILDLMLPGIDGLEICRRVRAAEAADGSTPLPILMLTARDAVNDRVTGLEAGADDYLVKPFAFEELLARVRALLRRSAQTHPTANVQILSFDDLAIDQSARTVRRNDRDIDLSVREYDLLTLFLHHPNQVLPRDHESRVGRRRLFRRFERVKSRSGNCGGSLNRGSESQAVQTIHQDRLRFFGRLDRSWPACARSIRFRLTAWYATVTHAGAADAHRDRQRGARSAPLQQFDDDLTNTAAAISAPPRSAHSEMARPSASIFPRSIRSRSRYFIQISLPDGSTEYRSDALGT
ncbi:MAG: response regulator transcription factor [Thermomicrobiales bacterium]